MMYYSNCLEGQQADVRGDVESFVQILLGLTSSVMAFPACSGPARKEGCLPMELRGLEVSSK